MTQAPIKSLVDVAMPAMRDLAPSTAQSCHLVVPSGDQIVVIARIESPGDLLVCPHRLSAQHSARNFRPDVLFAGQRAGPKAIV